MVLKSAIKTGLKLISLFALMFLSSQLIAGDQNTRVYELEQANKGLNEVYKKIAAQLSPVDQLKLKKAQRAWIVFRDLDCTWAFAAEPLDCMIDRTDNRTKELEQTDFFNIKGAYLSIDN